MANSWIAFAAGGELPFLHVRPENIRAIQLYERLGFKQRASFYYAVLRRKRNRPFRDTIQAVKVQPRANNRDAASWSHS